MHRRLYSFGLCRGETLQLFLVEIRVPHIKLTFGKRDGLSAESANLFKAIDLLGNVAGGYALHFLSGWTRGDVISQYFIQPLGNRIGITAGLHIRLNVNQAAVHERDHICRNAHDALFLTHKDIVQTRAGQATKRAHANVQRICIRVGQSRHHPVAINTCGRNLVLHHDFNRLFQRRYRRVDGRNIFAALDAAEPFFNERFGLRGVDIACQHEHRIIWTIMVGEPIFHVIQRCRRQVFQAANRVMMIRVANGEQGFRTLVIDQSKWLVVALTLFVRNNADLVVELFLGNSIEQIAHAVAFEE